MDDLNHPHRIGTKSPLKGWHTLLFHFDICEKWIMQEEQLEQLAGAAKGRSLKMIPAHYVQRERKRAAEEGGYLIFLTT